MDGRRRALLQAIAVVGLAGCAPRAVTRTVAQPSPSPSPTAPPSPSPTAAPSPSPVAATPSPTPAPVVRPVRSRTALGLRAAAPGGQPHTITGLLLHHTGLPAVGPDDAPARWRSIARAHREAGFVDVAYHLGIDAAGTVYELRDEAIAGETYTSYDPAGWLLVVCDGNYDVASPTPELLAAAADVLAAGAMRHGVAPSTLVGHRDLATTACPGDGLARALPTLVDMVQERLDAGGVVLEVTDDPALPPS